MYGAFYGVEQPPFDLTPNPRFLFLTQRQREALSNLRYALATSRGFSLLVGDAGTGKTTLIRAALAELTDAPSRYVLISNPTLGRTEFYEFIERGFGLSHGASASKTHLLAELQQNVEERFAAGGLTGLIIDEAQSLPYEILEEIRLLGNIETTTAKLLNIVLAGQPELADRLNEPSLRQLKQRISLRCELSALAPQETAAYIAGRVRIAGGVPDEVFSEEAVVTIHRAARGNPRTINVLCDNALINGFAAEVKPIPAALVRDVCRDFDIAVPVEDARPEIVRAAAAAPEAPGAPVGAQAAPVNPAAQAVVQPAPVGAVAAPAGAVAAAPPPPTLAPDGPPAPAAAATSHAVDDNRPGMFGIFKRGKSRFSFF